PTRWRGPRGGRASDCAAAAVPLPAAREPARPAVAAPASPALPWAPPAAGCRCWTDAPWSAPR
ncbi:MAG: hypothetical protein EPO03_13155, partial [Porticoccaceae bacterium]